MTTGSAQIPNFDFEVQFDLTASPRVTFVNRSTGLQVGCKVAFVLNGPAGPIHIGDIDTPDVTGAWSTFTVPDNLPALFDFGVYQVIGILKAPDLTNNVTYSRDREICRPGGTKPGDSTNFGVGMISYLVKCQEAKIFANDTTNYSYKGVQGTLNTRTLTLKYPDDSTGIAPADVIVTGFPAANFNIPYNGEDYELLLSSNVTYDIGDNFFVTIQYYLKQLFPVTCNIDLCAIKCAVEEFAQDVQCKSTPAKQDKLALLNTKLSLLALSIMQPSCGSAADIVKEIITIGNFKCNCYMSGSTSGIGSTPTQNCDATYACIDIMLESLNPGCLMNINDWKALTLPGKFQALITKICSSGGGASGCTAPINVVFDAATKILHWDSTSGAGSWQIVFFVSNPGGDVIPIVFTSSDPVNTGGNHWQVDMSSVAFTLNTDYGFSVVGYCNDGTSSNPVTITTTPSSSCTAAQIQTVVIS